jgi:hypothetical protein
MGNRQEKITLDKECFLKAIGGRTSKEVTNTAQAIKEAKIMETVIYFLFIKGKKASSSVYSKVTIGESTTREYKFDSFDSWTKGHLKLHQEKHKEEAVIVNMNIIKL